LLKQPAFASALPASAAFTAAVDLGARADQQQAAAAEQQAAEVEAAFLAEAMDGFEQIRDLEVLQGVAGEAVLDQWARDNEAAAALATLAERERSEPAERIVVE